MQFIIYAVILSVSFLALHSSSQAGTWPHRDQLRTEISFWVDIFAKHGDNSIVLHDPHDLSLVYKTITLSPGESGARREQRIRAAKIEVENSLRSLAESMAAGRNLTAQQKKLRGLFGASATPRQVKMCASRIRAQQGIADRFYKGLQRSTAYMPAIKKIFRDKGLPEELAYLPHVESSFNLKARSKAGAAGMWQFMKPTAKTFSLKMNYITDERMDPLVASEAAAVLLQQNYEKLGDWGLALTAYNFGLGGMSGAARACGANYMSVRKNFSHPRFKFASKNFYPEFLAAVEIMKKPAAYFPGYTPRSRHTIVQHRLQKSATLPALAKKWGLELSGLQELNPGFTKKAWEGRLRIPAGYSVNIARGRTTRDVQIATAEPDVRMASLKQKPSPSAALKQAAARGEEAPQKRLQLAGASAPPRKRSEQSAQKITASAEELCLKSLRREIAPVIAVKKGSIQIFGNETLGHVAQWLKLSPAKLCKLNKIKSAHNLRQRQKLLLDFSRVTEAEFAQARLAYHLSAIESLLRKHNLDQLIQYRMSANDSLQQLAASHFKIPASLIVYFNSGQNLNRLLPGSVIRVPVSRQDALHIL